MKVTEPVGVPFDPATLTERVTEAPGVAVAGTVSVTVATAGATINDCAAETLEEKLESPG